MTFSKDWMRTQWRPLMAIVYLVTCLTDFIFFPIFWAVFQAYIDAAQISPWNPLTLQGAGLYHVAMGAVLGVAAWTRGQEKITALQSPEQTYNRE